MRECGDIDLGDGHSMCYVQWSPDRSIPSNAELYAGIPDVEKYCATIYHKNAKGEPCMGCITFDGPVARQIDKGKIANHLWTVESWEPLTVSPSVLCSCGDHGFIRGGKWQRA